MKAKLARSVTSTNFWNNVSSIASAIVGGILLAFINDPQTALEGGLMILITNGMHNAGNILAHMNKPQIPTSTD